MTAFTASRAPSLRGSGAGPCFGQPLRAESRFRDEGDRARAGDSRRKVLRIVSGQEQHGNLGVCRPDSAAGLETVDAGQLNIHQHEVGVQVAGGQDRLLPCLSLADDLETMSRVHDLSGRGPKGFLVVADQNLDHGLSLPAKARAPKGACTMPGGGASPILGAMPIRVVLADDSFIVREGMRELLKSVDELDVVAVCSDLDTLSAAIDP